MVCPCSQPTVLLEQTSPSPDLGCSEPSAVSAFTGWYEDLGTEAKTFGDWKNAEQVAVASSES